MICLEDKTGEMMEGEICAQTRWVQYLFTSYKENASQPIVYIFFSLVWTPVKSWSMGLLGDTGASRGQT